MSDLKYYVEDKGLTEEEMIKNISIIVDDINHKGDKVKETVKHFWILILGVIISLVLGLPYFVPMLFGIASFTVLLLCGHFSNKRKERIDDYWFIVIKCKDNGVLNKDNLEKIEKFKIDELFGNK